MKLLRLPRNFRSQIAWQWRAARIGGLLVWPAAILVITAFRATKAGANLGETLAQGVLMIGGGILIVAGAWCIKNVLEGLVDLTERRK